MKRFVFCVRDSAAEAFASPWLVAAKGLAVRSFTDEVNREAADNPVYAHPEHYDLYLMGTFDDFTGLFETGTPEVVAYGKDVSTKYVPEAKLRAVQ